MSYDHPLDVSAPSRPWNKGRLIAQKRPLGPKDVGTICVRLDFSDNRRDSAIFGLTIDSKLLACDLVRLKVCNIQAGGRTRATVVQKRTGRPVQFAITNASAPHWTLGSSELATDTAAIYSQVELERSPISRHGGRGSNVDTKVLCASG